MYFFYFFEDEIINLIESSLSGQETLEPGEIQSEYGYDFFLPTGCKKLGFLPRTAFLIKRRLAPGIVSIAMQDAINLVEQKKIEHFVVIYEEYDASSIFYKPPLPLHNKFYLISGHDLKLKTVGQLTPQTKEWKEDRENRLSRLKYDLQTAPNTLFVGAGLSCSLGVPDWDTLLGMLSKKVKLEAGLYEEITTDCRNNNLLIARYLKNEAKSQKKKLVTYLRSILYKNETLVSSHLTNAVVNLIQNKVFEEIITYNFDNYLEKALTDKGVKNNSIDSQSRRMKHYLPVFHVHGMIHPTDKTFDKNVVLTEDEYHELYRDSYHWANVAQLYALTHTTCLFVGLSMADPSLRRLLDIASRQGTGNIEHYAFLRRDEYKNHREAEDIFSQMGVGIIWCENKNDVAIQVRQLI